MQYNGKGEIMDEKIFYALIAAALIGGGFLGSTLDQSKPIYQCESKNLLSNCFKLGSSNQRCYYNETAPLKYGYCSEGWALMSIDSINPENLGTSGVLIKDFNLCSRCEVEGCSKCQ